METRHLKRTVLIGLGGTGKYALLHAKRRLIETFGEIPPLVKFLLIDTTPANSDALEAITPDGARQTLRLLPQEVLHIEARGASLLPKVHDEVQEWFPPQAELKANILSGAGQIRALGRLALFANARTVYDNLRDLLAFARDYRAERVRDGQRYRYEAFSPHLTVCVASSLAGGTGAGTFLDVAFILRDMMKDEDQLFGYLLLPDIYVNRPGTQNVEANAYAALKELDHFMSLPESFSYHFGGREIEVRKKPFDMVFLVNRENRAGKTFNEIEHLTELMGTGLFLVSGPLGKEQADVFDNIVMQLNEQQGSFYGKTAHYASFGCAEIVFEPAELTHDWEQQVRKQTVAELLGASGQPWPADEIRRLVEAQLFSVAVSPEDEERPPEPSTSTRDDREKLRDLQLRIDGYPDRLAEKVVKRWNAEQFGKELRQILKREFSENQRPLASLAAGLESAVKDVEQRIAEQQGPSQKERNVLQDSLAHLQQSVERRIQRRTAWRNPFAAPQEDEEPLVTRRTISDPWQNAKRVGEQKARLDILERMRGILDGACNRLKERQTWLTEESEGDATNPEAGRTRSFDERPFTETLPPRDVALETKAKAESKAAELRQKGLETLLESRETLRGLFQEIVRKPEGLSLESFLRQAQDEMKNGGGIRAQAVEGKFRELDALSAPAWDYQDAWISNPKLGQHEQVYIIGVENKGDDKHPIRSEEIESIFAGNLHARMRLQYVSTGDPRRVIFYRIEASIPAFTLRNLEMYRERYQQLREQRSFHIDRRWEDKLPDLLPLPSEDEALSVWVRARLFDLIRHDKGQYTRRSRAGGTERWHELGSSPAKAFAQFKDKFFGFKETEADVKEQEQEWRRSKLDELRRFVEDAIENRTQKLSGDNGGWSPEDLELFRREKEELERWRDELAQRYAAGVQDDLPSANGFNPKE